MLLFLVPFLFLIACSSDTDNGTTFSSVSSLFSNKPLQHKEVALAFIENLARGKLKDAMTEWYDLVMVDDEWKVDLHKTTKRNEKIRRSKKLKKQREEEKEFYNKEHSKFFKVPASYTEKE